MTPECFDLRDLFYGPFESGPGSFEDTSTEPGREEREAKCKDICRRCPLLVPCREFALVRREEWGVWGGMTEGERRQFRKWCRAWGFDDVPARPVLDFLLDFFHNEYGPGPVVESNGPRRDPVASRKKNKGSQTPAAQNGTKKQRQNRSRSA